jgi:MFS family permease
VLLFSTIVTIEAMTFQAPALPTILRHFGMEMNAGALVILLFYSASASFAPLTGRLADQMGRRRMMLIGLALFSASEFAAAVSPSFAFLLTMRFLQGVSVACILPTVYAYVGHLFGPSHRGLALGILAATMSLGAASGAVAGGLLVRAHGWASIYWVSGSLGVASFVLMAVSLPETPRTGRVEQLDWAGSLLMLLNAAAWLSIPTALSKLGPTSGWTLALLVVGVMAVGGLWRVEQRAAHPLLDLDLLRSARFIGPTCLYMMNTVAIAALTYALGFFIHERPGGDAAQMGLVNMCMYGAAILSAPLSGRWADRGDPRRPVIVGLFGAALAMGTLGVVGLQTPLWQVLMIVTVGGACSGIAAPPLLKMMMAAVPAQRLASGAGMFSMIRDIGNPAGATCGLALYTSLGAWAASRWLAQQTGEGPAATLPQAALQQAAHMHGLQGALPWVAACVGIWLCAAAVMACRLRIAGPVAPAGVGPACATG